MMMFKIKFVNGLKSVTLSITATTAQVAIQLAKQQMEYDYPAFIYNTCTITSLRLLQEAK